MDFTSELTAFQGAIHSTDYVHPFSRLSEKGGNEEKIASVLNSVLKFLKATNMINDGIVENMIPEIRKFALYIFLNANLHTLEELLHKEEIGPMIRTVPTIPKLLMCEFIYNLHMEQFLYEVVVFTYPPLALEVSAAFLDHLKYSTPTNCLDKVGKLSVACYILICRLHLFNFGEKFAKILTDAGNNFQKCIKYLIDPPNSGKLNMLSKNDLYKYKGNNLNHALLLVYECLSQFTSKQEKKPSSFEDIYELTYIADTVTPDITSYNIGDCRKEIVDLLNMCNEMMLDACKLLVMDISVDIFCAWSEFEENGKTMQQSIGELCHKLRTKLLTISSVAEHPLVNMIAQLARKPADIIDLINSADISTIKEKIQNNNEESRLWLHALIDKNQLCNYTELLDIIKSNLQEYNEEECHKLYEILNSNMENKELAIKVFHQCNITVKYQLLDKQFTLSTFVDMEETADFKQMMIETFNKLINQADADLSEVLTLFLQSPRQVFYKMFNLALESSQQTSIMLNVAKLIKKYASYYYENETEPCIIKVTQKIFELEINTDEKQNNFVKFVCGLKQIDLIPGTKLLLLFIMPNLHKSLLESDMGYKTHTLVCLNVEIKLLCDAFSLEELMQYRAPVLAMLAQVLDVVRWKLHTFCMATPVILQNAITLQKSVMDTYNNSVPDNEGTWLRTRLKKANPLTMYYYRQLWNPPGNNFLETVAGITITRETSLEQLTTIITRLIIGCTQEEWCEIWDSLRQLDGLNVLTIFFDVITLISTAEAVNSTANSWLCLMYLCRCLIYVIRYKYFKEPLTNDQVSAVTHKIASLPIIQKGKSEDIEALLLPLFSYLAERRNDYTFDLSQCKNLQQPNLTNVLEKILME